MLGELFDQATNATTTENSNNSGITTTTLPLQFPPELMPIGRLDEMSEGLLLVTTSGTLTHRVNTGGVEKEYWCQLDGVITEDARKELAAGGFEISIQSGGGGELWRPSPCRVVVLEDEQIETLPPRRKKVRDDRHGPTSWVSVTIKEGKNRQVRRMTAAIGYPTLRLVRVRVGCIYLLGCDDGGRERRLQPGGIRELEEKELSMLNTLTGF